MTETKVVPFLTNIDDINDSSSIVTTCVHL